MSQPPRMLTRPGLTLLELLAALALMSLVIAAAGSWCVGMAKAERAIRTASAAATPLDRALAAIDRDIRRAPSPAQRAGGVVFDAAKREITIPERDRGGEQPREPRAIRWRFDAAEAALIREAAPDHASIAGGSQSRVVLRGVGQFKIDPITRPVRPPSARGEPAIVGFRVTVEAGGRARSMAWEARP